jgi:hypothetical protein
LDLGEIPFYDLDWVGVTQDMEKWKALVNVAMNLRPP